LFDWADHPAWPPPPWRWTLARESPVPARPAVPKIPPPEIHFLCLYKVPYILPSSVYSKPFLFTLFSKLPGCTSSLPILELVIRHSSLATASANLPLCFQSVARCSSRNSFLFTLLHCCRAWVCPSPPPHLKSYLNSLPSYPASRIAACGVAFRPFSRISDLCSRRTPHCQL